jgi:dTDP-D-glucose 4,6-dehydratase
VRLDCIKLHAELGLDPQRHFITGITKILDWYLNNPQRPLDITDKK